MIDNGLEGNEIGELAPGKNEQPAGFVSVKQQRMKKKVKESTLVMSKLEREKKKKVVSYGGIFVDL